MVAIHLCAEQGTDPDKASAQHEADRVIERLDRDQHRDEGPDR